MFKIKIGLTPRYKRELEKYVRNNKRRNEQIKKSLGLLSQNTMHPSLNIERLKGPHIWTIRINKGDRIFFKWYSSVTILLLDIGPHDKYKHI